MKEIHYHFVDLDSDESFERLGKTLGGTLKDNTLIFDNECVKGELVKATPDIGLWMREWKFTTIEKIVLHKHKAPDQAEKKLILIYFLNPSIFSFKHNSKALSVSSPCNNIFLNSTIDMDFSVVPKQPFYVIDIAFTTSWIIEQFKDADKSIREVLAEFTDTRTHDLLKKPCSKEEYKLLHELELSMASDVQDLLFVRSRVYNLVFLFFKKIIKQDESGLINKKINYEQIMHVNEIIEENLSRLPKLDAIAKKVNLSVSSLLRQFRLIYGKSIYEYHIERKMELAKKMILEEGKPVAKLAEMLGYKQASHFIESFTKYHGYSPGSLKLNATK
jgi:AraC-like DNA-binding protein